MHTKNLMLIEYRVEYCILHCQICFEARLCVNALLRKKTVCGLSLSSNFRIRGTVELWFVCSDSRREQRATRSHHQNTATLTNHKSLAFQTQLVHVKSASQSALNTQLSVEVDTEGDGRAEERVVHKRFFGDFVRLRIPQTPAAHSAAQRRKNEHTLTHKTFTVCLRLCSRR